MSRQVQRALERANKKAEKKALNAIFRGEVLEKDAAEETLEQKMAVVVQDALGKGLPEIMDSVFEKKIKEITEKPFSDIEDIKKAIAELSFEQKSSAQ